MRILYISDLDELVLNSARKISPFSIDVINRYIANGGLFTIAASCMAFGCERALAEFNLTVPGIIMNGVCLYSFDTGKYHDVKPIDTTLLPEIEAVFAAHDCHTLLYVFAHEKINIFHTQPPSEADAFYLSQRAYEACGEITQVPVLVEAVKNHKAMCVAAIGSQEKMAPVYEHVHKMADLETIYYPFNNFYCLEVYDHSVSKANAALKLKKKTHATELTVFGNSSNDVGMMEAADYCFAPRNGTEDARKIANGLIESCEDDGVARFIQLRHNL